MRLPTIKFLDGRLITVLLFFLLVSVKLCMCVYFVVSSPYLCFGLHCLLEYIKQNAGWLNMCDERTVNDTYLCPRWLISRAYSRLEEQWYDRHGLNGVSDAFETFHFLARSQDHSPLTDVQPLACFRLCLEISDWNVTPCTTPTNFLCRCFQIMTIRSVSNKNLASII